MDDKIKAKENFSINKFDQNKTRTEIYEFNQETLERVVKEMDERRKNWLKQYKTSLDLNDVLEIRNP